MSEEGWRKIGEVGVDGGAVLIADSNYAHLMEHDTDESWNDVLWKDTHVGFCPGVEVASGLGDGHYSVYAKFREHPDGHGRRIAQVLVRFDEEWT